MTLGNPSVPGEVVVPRGVDRPPAVILLSGAGPNDLDETVGQTKPLRDIAYGLAEKGIASLRFDKPTRRGTPSSTFTPTEEYVGYSLAGFDLLASSNLVDTTRVFVLGHSFGGTMAPRVVAARPEFAGVVLMAALAGELPDVLLRHFRHLTTLGGPLASAAAGQVGVAEDLRREITGALRRGVRMRSPLAHEAIGQGVTGSYFLDLRDYDAPAAAATLGAPILILQGDRDYLVTVDDDLARWTKALAGRDDVTVRRYPLASHTMVDGQGVPTPEEYQIPGHVNPLVVDDIAEWVKGV
ncbi:MAG: alpha/beta fold hydrolase [Acidimicrobiales bacterium]|nr:alpha/beta fold hydrolase [Acidimicrobiales bacterium]